jgi:hypothetical protein
VLPLLAHGPTPACTKQHAHSCQGTQRMQMASWDQIVCCSAHELGKQHARLLTGSRSHVLCGVRCSCKPARRAMQVTSVGLYIRPDVLEGQSSPWGAAPTAGLFKQELTTMLWLQQAGASVRIQCCDRDAAYATSTRWSCVKARAPRACCHLTLVIRGDSNARTA